MKSLIILILCYLFRRKDEKVIPFRDSKLTQLLQPYFVGKGRQAREGHVVMMVNVSNNCSSYEETIHALDFSALTSKVIPVYPPPP